jgi:DNA-binding NtrC family response regulator
MRVLVAVAPDSVTTMQATLGAHYSLVFPGTVEEAKATLASQAFQLIVCGFRFDESRMVDLLTHCKSTASLAGIPFVCVRVATGWLSTSTYNEMGMAAHSLGAYAFDLSELLKTDSAEAAGVYFQKFVASAAAK